MDNSQGPHLRVQETGTQEVAVFGSGDCDLVRSTRANSDVSLCLVNTASFDTY